jgi:hypothetical protein
MPTTRWIKYLLGLLILAGSCSPQKKMDNAVELVKSNRGALDKVYPYIRQLYPCVNDTSTPHVRIDTGHVFLPISSFPEFTQLGNNYKGQKPEGHAITPDVYRIRDSILYVLQQEGIFLNYGFDRTFSNGASMHVSKDGINIEYPRADTSRFIKDLQEIEYWKKLAQNGEGVRTVQEQVISEANKRITQQQTAYDWLKIKYWLALAGAAAGLLLSILKISPVSGIVNLFKRMIGNA